VFESIFIGCGFAFAAAVQPGPLQAFLFSRVAQKGWKRTLPASFAPLFSDGPIAVLMIFMLDHVSTAMCGVLQFAGGILLLYFAWTSYRQWKKQEDPEPATSDSVPQTLMQAAAVNILNPNVYLGWSLVLGPAVLSAWHKNPEQAVALVLAFYITMVCALAGTIFLFGTSRFLSAKGKRTLVLISSILLALIGVYQVAVILFRSIAV
jgi:threonine/homoserine/homoserine lactone efflux protein